MAVINHNKPRDEFWKITRDLIEFCKPEELRILRIMAGTELEKRLKQWSAKIEVTPEAKARKNKAIKRNINRVRV